MSHYQIVRNERSVRVKVVSLATPSLTGDGLVRYNSQISWGCQRACGTANMNIIKLTLRVHEAAARLNVVLWCFSP
jgi:hypothetical protein